jgi:hypothetical protein
MGFNHCEVLLLELVAKARDSSEEGERTSLKSATKQGQ